MPSARLCVEVGVPGRTRLLFLVLAVCLLSSCSSSLATGAQGGPRCWIDAPRQGSLLPLAPVEVASRARHPLGVSQLQLWVNGALVASDPSPDPRQSLRVVSQTWQPGTPGSYVLQVRARSASGVWGPFARADVTVSADIVLPTATPLPSATPTATVTPSPTPTEVPTPAPTDTPASVIVVEPTSPSASPTPLAPPPTAPVPAVPGPAISGPDVSTTRFYYGGAGCGPQELTVRVRVSDPGGVAGVRLYYILADKASGTMTRWSFLEMAPGEGHWSCTVVAARDIPGYNSFQHAWFEFYFLATNSQGGRTKSPGYWTGFTLSRCGG